MYDGVVQPPQDKASHPLFADFLRYNIQHVSFAGLSRYLPAAIAVASPLETPLAAHVSRLAAPAHIHCRHVDWDLARERHLSLPLFLHRAARQRASRVAAGTA